MSCSRNKTDMHRLLMCVLLSLSYLSAASLAQAQSDPASEIIQRVNELRASYGLPAYQIDSVLMSVAQAQATWCAENNHIGHDGPGGSSPNDRAQAAGYGGGSSSYAIENAAHGTADLNTPQLVVTMWQGDWGHLNAMISPDYEHIGVGYAEANGYSWYVMMVGWVADGSSSVTVIAETGTPIPVLPLETSIPRDDGSIIHAVGYGQTLWSIAIAYGVTVDDIRRLNGIAGDSTMIYAGQKLLIRPAHTVTPTMSGETSDVSTETSTRSWKGNPASTVTPSSFAAALLSTTSITITPSPFLTSSPTNPAIVPSTVLSSNRVVVIVVLLVIAVLLPTVILSFRVSGRMKMPREQ